MRQRTGETPGLLVRVASYVAYFTELSPNQQMDIINRTEQQGW
jgi:pyruvate-formate lyase